MSGIAITNLCLPRKFKDILKFPIRELSQLSTRLPPKPNPVPPNVKNAPIESHFKLLVLGGGAGGISIAQIFTRYLKSLRGGHQIALVEPSPVHYYQPMWTLVGAGIEPFDKSVRKTADLIPKGVVWFEDCVVKLDPDNNNVTLESGRKIGYDFMVVALGLKLDMDKIPGLAEGLNDPDSGIVCNYSSTTVRRTFPAIQKLKDGNAIFTQPTTPIKCAGAAQKIMYLTEDYVRKHGLRKDVEFHFMTPADTLFPVTKYSKALLNICEEREINFHPHTNLVRVDPKSREAYFEICQVNPTNVAGPQMGNDPNKDAENSVSNVTYKFSMIHVVPPMSAPDVIRNSPLADGEPLGYMKVDKYYLNSLKFPNVYGIGDCTNAPKSKTAAAVAGELKAVRKNLKLAMEGKSPIFKTDGYTSCPVYTQSNKVMLMEFNYDKNPIETFPMNQAVPRRSMFWMKRYLMPFLYWNIFLKGYWEGPKFFRKIWTFGSG